MQQNHVSKSGSRPLHPFHLFGFDVKIILNRAGLVTPPIFRIVVHQYGFLVTDF